MFDAMDAAVVTATSITADDFDRMFDFSPSDVPADFGSRLVRIDTRHKEPSGDELNEYLLHVLQRMCSAGATRNRDENLEAWELGWRQNLEFASSAQALTDALRPRYFRPSKFLRYRQGLIVSENPNLEYDLFDLARRLIFARYLADYEEIYELGCGSCQNLLALSDMFPTKELHGLDWAESSVEIAQLLARVHHRNISGLRFDMTAPPEELVLKPGSAIVTIHALEQLGAKHDKLLEYLMASKPGIVVHYEPILEFYDTENMLDCLALAYSQKRDYLSGFWPALNRFQADGRIEIIEARRPYLGGVIHESSLIVWRPTE